MTDVGPRLDHAGAESLAAALRSGATTAAAHTERVLDRAATLGPTVGAFAHLLPELSRAQAEHADAAIARGDARPLVGVPLPVKALTRIAGVPWDAGSVVLRGTVAEVTDGVAEDILAAGTVTIGTTTVPEFGFPCYTEPVGQDPARTPWDTRRTAGGSSGGAAAAVATGIVPLAHGSDGGGSVRIPAACCGVVGLKTSRGLVSPGPHGSEGPGLVADGILARTVRDVALGLDVIVHTRPGDAYPLASGTTTFRQACEHPEPLRGGLRVGLLTEPLNIRTVVHPAALRATERAAELLRGQGCEVVEIGAPFTPEQWQAFFPLWAVGAASIPLPDGAEDHVTALTRWLREQGREVTGRELAAASIGMQTVARRAGEAFAAFDVILTPSLSGPPALPETLQLPDPAADFAAQCAFTPWTSTWNMTGRAAVSVPLHRETLDGVELPFGVHLGAVRAGDDDLLLAVAALLERLDPWPLVTPVRAPSIEDDEGPGHV
ncbi:amidase [Brachybacterium sp. AOP25-B2-12]|uniref:amidase n=1 Tax=Brachybacterium sp. AOP25-B2-12 TaxID=3457710 RepID=UPI00403421D2